MACSLLPFDQTSKQDGNKWMPSGVFELEAANVVLLPLQGLQVLWQARCARVRQTAQAD